MGDETSGLAELRRLAMDAAREAPTPRALKCWPWSHRWTMWQPDFQGSICQRRRCLRCGLSKGRVV